MPNVNDLYEFLQASDVENGDLLTFVNSGEFVDRDYSPAKDGSEVKTILQIRVALPGGKEKVCSPNNTSLNAIKAEYTPDTENWIHKKVKVDLLKQNVKGQMRDVVYLTPFNSGEAI